MEQSIVIPGKPDQSTLSVLAGLLNCEEEFTDVLDGLWKLNEEVGADEGIHGLMLTFQQKNCMMPWEQFINQLELSHLPNLIVTNDIGISTTGPKSVNFEVAISYSGQKEVYVSAIATALAAELGKDSVFLATHYSPQLAKPRMVNVFREIFLETPLVVVFLNESYNTSDWCRIEWDVIQERIIHQNGADNIMLIKMDDAPIADLLKNDGFIDSRKNNIGQVIDNIVTRQREGAFELGVDTQRKTMPTLLERYRAPLNG